MLKLEKVAIAEMTLKVTQVVVKGTLFDHLLVSEMTYNVSMGTLNPTILHYLQVMVWMGCSENIEPINGAGIFKETS